jgi:hypothetical protein
VTRIAKVTDLVKSEGDPGERANLRRELEPVESCRPAGVTPRGVRSPGPGQEPTLAGILPGQDDPTAAAELVIMLFPPGTRDVGNTGKPPRFTSLMRRIGPKARLAAPASGSGMERRSRSASS